MELSLRFVIVFDSLLLICFTYKKKMSFLLYIYIYIYIYIYKPRKIFWTGSLQEQIPRSALACNDTFVPPKPFLCKSNIDVLNISLLDGEMRITNYYRR
jgi:hypothetical protein